MHTLLVKAVLLVIICIVAELTSARCFLVAVKTKEDPTISVVLVMSLVHERIVEVTEADIEEFRLSCERRIALVSSINRDAPCRILEICRHLLEECCLEFLRRESLSHLARTVINMVLSPETETSLHECKTWVIIISLCKSLVEIQVESLKFLTTPVREICCTAFALSYSLLISRPCLDIIRNCTLLSYICIAETHYQLMTARSHLIKKLIHRSPVIHIFFLADLIVQHIRIFELNIFLI